VKKPNKVNLKYFLKFFEFEVFLCKLLDSILEFIIFPLVTGTGLYFLHTLISTHLTYRQNKLIETKGEKAKIA